MNTTGDDESATVLHERAPEDEPEVLHAMDAAARERAFWEANAPRLTRKYPDRFVAVLDAGTQARDGTPQGRVIGTATDLAELEPLRLKWRAQGWTPERVWVRYLSAAPRRYILHCAC